MRSGKTRFLPAALALLALVLALSPFSVRPAYAHATLISSSPGNNEPVRRPPVRVILHFSEGLVHKLTRIEVLDNNHQRVDNGDTAFDDNDPTLASVGVKVLPPGLYFVQWSNVSVVDGHNLSGTFPFIVLNPDGSYPAGVTLNTAAASTTSSGGQLLPNNFDVVLKWLALLALTVVAGAAFMMIAGLRPAAAFLDDDAYNKFADAIEGWVVWLSHVLIPVSFIASAFLVLLTVNRFATGTSMVSYLTTVRTGQYRLAGMILLLVALAGANVVYLARSARRRDAGLAVLLLASLGAMFTYSMTSHGGVNPGKFWGIASDFLHLDASAAWLGALAMLVPLLRWARRELDEQPRFLLLASAFDRFSIIAGLSVLVILVTGTFNGLAEIPDAGAMIHTTYGKVLLAKLALIAPLLAVAAFNAVVLKPRLVAATEAAYGSPGEPGSVRGDPPAGRPEALRRLLAILVPIEIALVIAVFASVSVLTQAATAKGEVAQKDAAKAAATKYSQKAEAGGLKMLLEITPNRVGLNQFDLTLQNPDGTPATTVTQARLRFNYEQLPGTLPPSEIILRKRADGEYTDIGSYFTEQGNWRVEVGVRRSNADDVSHQFILAVAPGQSASSSAHKGSFTLPFTVFVWNEVAGALLAVAGAAIVIYRRQLRWLSQLAYRGTMTAAAALLLVGAVLAFGVHSHTTAINPSADNPIKPTQQSVDAGRALYQKNCAICHGADGRGDGPGAAELNPQPADFRLHMPYHTDAQFFTFIAAGYPQSAMIGYRKVLSDTDIWNLINFLRASFSSGASQ